MNNKVLEKDVKEFLTNLGMLKKSLDSQNEETKKKADKEYPLRILEYCSENFAVIRVQISEDITIFKVEDAYNGETEHISYLRNDKLAGSHLINIINRRESLRND